MTKFINSPPTVANVNFISDWHCFSLIIEKGVFVKRKTEISNLTVSDIIFLIMSNTGMTREQAAITVQNIVAYMREHTTEPLHKIVQHFFGGTMNEERQAKLN
jgi:hypothetical protein